MPAMMLRIWAGKSTMQRIEWNEYCGRMGNALLDSHEIPGAYSLDLAQQQEML